MHNIIHGEIIECLGSDRLEIGLRAAPLPSVSSVVAGQLVRWTPQTARDLRRSAPPLLPPSSSATSSSNLLWVGFLRPTGAIGAGERLEAIADCCWETPRGRYDAVQNQFSLDYKFKVVRSRRTWRRLSKVSTAPFTDN